MIEYGRPEVLFGIFFLGSEDGIVLVSLVVFSVVDSVGSSKVFKDGNLGGSLVGNWIFCWVF